MKFSQSGRQKIRLLLPSTFYSFYLYSFVSGVRTIHQNRKTNVNEYSKKNCDVTTCWSLSASQKNTPPHKQQLWQLLCSNHDHEFIVRC